MSFSALVFREIQMKIFHEALRREKEYAGILDCAKKRRVSLVSGVVSGLKPVFLQSLFEDIGRSFL